MNRAKHSLHKQPAFLLPLLLIAGMQAACMAQATKPAAAKPVRILFIGNSLTYVNDLPAELQAMATVAYLKLPAVHCESVTAGGATLERHWNFKTAAKRIAEGGWDYVVLQEQSQRPIIEPEQMFKYARLFDADVKKVGAKTILYMTWPRKQHPEDLAPLADAYNKLAKELGAIVIPAGTAWHEAQTIDPKLELYQKDGVHPSPAGTWLAASCFAEVLRGVPETPLPGEAGLGRRER